MDSKKVKSKFATVKGFAEKRGFSVHFVRQLIKNGQIPYICSGNKFYIDDEGAMTAIRNLSSAANDYNASNFRCDAQFMNAQNASDVIGLSVPMLQKGAKTGRFPHIKYGNRILFNVPAIIEILSKESMLTCISKEDEQFEEE